MHTNRWMRVAAAGGLAAAMLASAAALAAPSPGADPPTARTLIARADEIVGADPARARRLLEHAVAVATPGAERLNARNELCRLVVAFDPAAARAIASEGLDEARRNDDRAAEAGLLRCDGYAFESEGDLGTALARYEAAVAAGEAAGDRVALSDALAARGETRHQVGDYPGAVADLERAHALASAAGSDRVTSYALNAMANLYADRNVGEYDRAIGYYREQLARHQARGRPGEVATARYNLGATYESKGEFAAALQEYRAALAQYLALDDRSSVADARRVIGATLVKQGDADAALPWIAQALAGFETEGDIDGIHRTRLTRGIALRAAGRPREALADLDAAAAHFEAERNDRFLVRVEEERARAHADLGDGTAAYAALRRQFDLQRELDRRLAEERTARLRVQFDVQRTEELNRALRVENASRGAALAAAAREQRLQRAVIALAALLAAVLGALALRQWRRSRRLRVQALTDELTGLANRRSILAFLDDQLRDAGRRDTPLAVAALDIDHFKRINDTLGHDAGDRALQRLAALATSHLRGGERIGRVGGEEFLLVLPSTAPDAAAGIGERVRIAVHDASFDMVAPGTRVTLSVGIAAWDRREDAAALLRRADAALYAAKAQGRDRVVVAD